MPNPIIDELDHAHDNLSPGAREAIRVANQRMIQMPPPAAPGVAAPTLPGAIPIPGSAAGMNAPQAPGSIPIPEQASSANDPGRISISPRPAAGAVPAPTDARLIPIPDSLNRARAEVNRLTIPTVDHATGQVAARGQRQDLAGIDKLPGYARIPLKVLNGLATAFVPGYAAASMLIPGTELHHSMQTRGAEAAEAQQEKQATEDVNREHLGAETNELGARAENERSEAATRAAKPGLISVKKGEGLFDPNTRTWTVEPQEDEATEIDPEIGKHLGIKPTKDGRYLLPKGGASLLKQEVLHEFKDKDGQVWQIHSDGTATPVTANGQPLKGETPEEPLEDRIVDEYMRSNPGATLADARRATAVKEPTGDVGTWTLEEDKDGNPVLFNSRTAQTKPVEGIQKAGTAAKEAAVREKEQGPAKAAVEYARDYLKNGAFTGAGDEALQEKFFELAKPATGFRMSQPQMDMLRNSRGWMNSAVAHLRHATKGTWFSDEQRQQIIDTMEQLAKAKLGEGAPTPGQSGARTGQIQVQIPGQEPGWIDSGQKDSFLKKYPKAKVF